MPSGVILYGPPGSGKDTITRELSRIEPHFSLFERLKAGPGRSAGYRITTADAISRMSQAGELLYRNSRYGAEYAIERAGVSALVDSGRVPVLHMGQAVGVMAVRAFPISWIPVLLWCPRDLTEARCRARGDSDVEARVKVWDETRRDLLEHDTTPWSLVIATDRETPTEAAQRVAHAVSSGTVPGVQDIVRLVG
jgi:guanylate kinase